MDLKTVKNLLNLISESDVNEVEIEEGDFKIKVKKQADTIYKSESAPVYAGNQAGAGYQVTQQVPHPSPEHAPPQQPVANQPQPTAESTPEEDKYITIKSPIVGTFYRSPSPESDAFVETGNSVSKGDVLCIVEAMKIMNEIESEHSGKIVKILADNSQPVEFDQPLFLIDPS